jgi:hypothetical protein
MGSAINERPMCPTCKHRMALLRISRGALRPARLSVPPADEPRRSQSPSTPSRRMLWAGAPASFGRHIDSILINFGGPS